jgi:hypothetical protein
MQVKVAPDEKAVRQFHDALRGIGRISGKDFETVIKQEMSAVLTGAAKHTKKARVGTIRKNWKNQPGSQYAFDYQGPKSRKGKKYTAGEISRLTQRAAERRARGNNGKLVYYFPGSTQPKSYPSWLWSQIKERRKQTLENRLKARGLAASMFVRIGERLGIRVEAADYVKNARHHKRGQMPEFVHVRTKGSGDSYELGFVNSLTNLNRWTQAGNAFRKALNARANYFKAAVKLEASKKIKKVMDRYPGLGSMS